MAHKNDGTPFFSGERIPWTFAAAHPTIEKLDMTVTTWEGSYGRVGQDKVVKHYTEKTMPSDLFCRAYPCEKGGFDLSRYVADLAMSKETTGTLHSNCKGRIGRSPKGKNPGQQCSVWQVSIETKITYKSANEDKAHPGPTR